MMMNQGRPPVSHSVSTSTDKMAVLSCTVDSPQKKLENARAQKVTNFKLGISGKQT